MKKGYIAFAALCAAALASCTCPSAGEQRLRPSEYVSTLVGTQSDFSLSTGNTYPAVALPWGMNFWTPQTGKMGDGWIYTYGSHTIRGLKQTHQPSPWINDYGQFSIMPVRGKILNCLKEDYPRIFKSDIIMDLMRVLGCGVEIKDKRIKNLGVFDLDNLNWNKVIICTDADVDGYHIRTLVLTMLYRLVPTLIDEGYVYIAESPLYEINCKEKTYFAYTELEKNGILKEIGDQKCSINRSKGLGENDPDMMWLTTMNPETRRLIKVEPEDVTKMETMFNLLLGNDEAGRKRHISEHGKEYLDQLDLQ